MKMFIIKTRLSEQKFQSIQKNELIYAQQQRYYLFYSRYSIFSATIYSSRDLKIRLHEAMLDGRSIRSQAAMGMLK
jgi:hypothetical protein